MTHKGVFIVGTDTGVGKTLVSTALVSRWTNQGRRVAVMKPVETGGGDDADQLIAATGRSLDRALVNPFRFRLPAAPTIAAAREQTRVDFTTLEAAASTLARDADCLVVEGAGGLLVPFTDETTCADLVVRLQLPVLLVARTALGTINHTLLTIEALRARAIPLVGVVFSRSSDSEGDEEAESIALAARIGGFRILGLVPALSGQDKRAQCAAAIDTDSIWNAINA